MVIVDASTLAVDYRISGTFDSLSFQSFVSSTDTTYSYTTSFGNAVTLTGTGFAVNGFNDLTSGTIKPNMVVAGPRCSIQPSVEEVAERTIKVLKDTVGRVFYIIAFGKDNAVRGFAYGQRLCF